MRPVWPSKIGTIPGPVVAVKGYGHFRPGRPPLPYEIIEYKAARETHRRDEERRRVWTCDWWQPWQRGQVWKLDESGILHITKL